MNNAAGLAVALACAFALGALLRGEEQREHPRPMGKRQDCAEKRIENRPPVRESWILTNPLSCPNGWVANCPDFKPCRTACVSS